MLPSSAPGLQLTKSTYSLVRSVLRPLTRFYSNRPTTSNGLSSSTSPNSMTWQTVGWDQSLAHSAFFAQHRPLGMPFDPLSIKGAGELAEFSFLSTLAYSSIQNRILSNNAIKSNGICSVFYLDISLLFKIFRIS